MRRLCLGSVLCALSLLVALWPTQAMAADRRGSGDAGPAFTLIDQHHRKVSDKDLATKPTVIHFGFTHCPVICPTTLFEVSELMRELGPRADEFHFVFVTVDPERDTPEHLRNYIASFDARIMGLTGAPDQIEALAAGVNATISRQRTDDASYTFDHSIYAFLLAAGWKRQGTLYMGTGARLPASIETLNRLLEK